MEVNRIRTQPETAQQRQIRLRQEQQQFQRSNSNVPIFVMWDSSVPQREALASVEGVQEAVTASRQPREIRVLGSQRFGSGPFSSPDWYLEEAFRRQTLRRNVGFGPQVDVQKIMGLFHEEPWQNEPHWEVFVVNTDLTDRDSNGYLNFVLGSTNPFFPASVQSITRLMSQIQNPEIRAEMVKRLLRHEVGHMFGLPRRNFRVEEKLGLHCTNPCSMRQGLSIEEWARFTLEENHHNIKFCRDCLADFR